MSVAIGFVLNIDANEKQEDIYQEVEEAERDDTDVFIAPQSQQETYGE